MIQSSQKFRAGAHRRSNGIHQWGQVLEEKARKLDVGNTSNVCRKACYDGGGTFWQTRFFNDGTPSIKPEGISILYCSMLRCKAMGLFMG